MHQNHLWTFKNHPHLGPTPDLNQNLGVGMCRFSSLHGLAWYMARAENCSFVTAGPMQWKPEHRELLGEWGKGGPGAVFGPDRTPGGQGTKQGIAPPFAASYSLGLNQPWLPLVGPIQLQGAPFL